MLPAQVLLNVPAVSWIACLFCVLGILFNMDIHNLRGLSSRKFYSMHCDLYGIRYEYRLEHVSRNFE